MNRHLTAAAVMLSAAVVLAGCGSSADTGTSTPAPSAGSDASAATSTPASTPATTAASPAPSDAKYIGTVTTSGDDTAYTASYSVTPLIYGKDNQGMPEEVQQACGTSTTNTDVYIGGSVTLRYTKGNLAMTLTPVDEGPIGSADISVFPSQPSGMSLYQGGQWLCPEQGGDGTFDTETLQPGQSVTIPFWIDVADVISNSTPAITAQQAGVMTIGIQFTSNQIYGNATTTVSGPGAEDCQNAYELVLYPTSPPASTSCTAVK